MESEKKEKKKVEDKLKQDMKELQDDLDISKSQLGQIASLENQVAKYKGKLQEMAELQESNRQLQEQNKECVDKMVQMEQDSKHVTTLRKSLETYKDRLADLDAKLSSAIHDKEEQESLVVELKRKLTETEKKLELRDAEVAQAKAEAESLKAELNEAKTGNKAGSDIDNSDLNLRTDYARLQRENEILKESSGTVDQEKLLQLENELDDLKRVKEKLEKNCTAANAKISVLLKQLDVSAGSGEDAKKLQELTEKNTELTGKAAEMEGKCEEKDTEIRKLRESHDELTKKMMDLISQKDAPRSNGMDEVMKAKLAALEAQLDAERRQGALQEDLVTARLEKQYDRVLTTIKEQLQIRDRENDFYKKTLEEQVDVNKKEQRLMMSVFYEIGLRYHQLRAYCEQLKNENEAVILRLQSRLAPHEPEDGKPEEPPDQKEASLSGADKAESD